MKCGYYLHGKFNHLYTELYTELETGKANIKDVYGILKQHKVLNLWKGLWYVHQGDRSLDAIAHINRINRKYPGLIETEYIKETKNKYGKEGNEVYGANVNSNVLNTIIPEGEQAAIIHEHEEALLKANDEKFREENALSERIRIENTSESKGLVGQPENKSETQSKADKLKKNFKAAGVDVDVEFSEDMDDNVSGDVIGKGTNKAKIRLNEYYLLDDVVYHEFGHVYIDLLGMSNPLIRQAIKQLTGSDLALEVIDAYPHLDGVKLNKEILATAIGVEGAKITRKNPSKFQIILNKIFRAIGRIFGISPNAAAVLAEQMFAGEIKRNALVGRISSFRQQSKNRESFDEIVDQTKILVRNMLNIAKSKGNVKAQARIAQLEETLESINNIEDFTDFIDVAGDATSKISNKFNILREKLNNDEPLENEDVQAIVEMKQYLDGFEMLDTLEEEFAKQKKVRPATGEAFDTMTDKLHNIIIERRLLTEQYFEIGIPSLADHLLPHSVEEINTQIDDLIQNIRDKKRGRRFIQPGDKRYGEINRKFKNGTITEEEFDQQVEDLAVKQLEEKKSTRENLIALLTKATKDKTGFSFLFDPLLYSNDNALQLFTKSVKSGLYEANDKSREFLYELKEAYTEFAKDVGSDNVQVLNQNLLEEIDEWVRRASGKWEKITRVGFVNPLDVNRFKKAKREKVEEIKNKFNIKFESDFETTEEFEKYKDSLETYEVNGVKPYQSNATTSAHKKAIQAYYQELNPWLLRNTTPVKDAGTIAQEHEEKITEVFKELRALKRKIDDGSATPLQIEVHSKLEIEFRILADWRNGNYRIDQNANIGGFKGTLVKPSQGEMGPKRTRKTDYTNKRYQKIQNDPRLKKYYDFLWDKYKIAQDQLGNAGNRMSKNPWDKYSYYIPSIRKVDKDRAIEQGIIPTLEELWREGTDIVATDTMYGDRLVGLGGEEYKVIPVFYTQPLDKADISYDLAGSMAQFTHMSNMFEAKSKMQSHVHLMIDVIGARETSVTTPMGAQVMDVIAKGLGEKLKKSERPKTIKGTATNNFKHLMSFVDNVFFGEKQIKNQFNFFGKNFESSKLTGALAGFTAMNALAFNTLQAVNQSTLDNIIGYGEAAAGQFYDRTTWAIGKARYWSEGGGVSDLGKMAPTSFLGQINEMYDMVQGKFEDGVGRNVTGTKFKKLFTTDALFFLQHGAEHELQVSRGLSMLAFIKAKDKNGEQLKNKNGSDMTMLDAHKKDDKGRVRLDSKVANFDRMLYMNRLHGINKRTNGVYNDFDKAHLKRLWYGKLLMLFRGWMVPGFRRRFGHGEKWHVDQEMGTLTQGTYITLWGGIVDSLTNQKNAFADMTKLEKQNLRRTLIEINAFIGTMLLMAALGMGDDDEEKSYAINFLLYQARRLQTELGAYTPGLGIMEAVKLLESPTATLRPIEHTLNLLNSTFKNILYFMPGGENLVDEKHIYYQRRSGKNKRGELKWDNKAKRLVPVLNGLEKSRTPEEMLKWFNR